MADRIAELSRFLVTDGRAMNAVVVASEINKRWPSLSTADVARAVKEAARAKPEALPDVRMVDEIIIAVTTLQRRVCKSRA